MTRRLLVLVSLLFVAVMIAVWWSGYHGVDPRLIFWPPPIATGPPAALDETAELDVEGAPLFQVLDDLAMKHGVAIELDAFAKTSQGLTGAEPVSLHLSNVSLRSLLAHLARQLDLVVRSRGGIVYLTTDSDWTSNLANYEPRIYTLQKFLAGPQPSDEEQIVDLVTTLIAPSNWEDAGGIGVCIPLPGALVVSQTPELQDQVARLLGKLAELNGDPATTEPVWLDPPTKRTQAVLAALAQTARIDADKVPLAKVVDQLSRDHNVPIQLDMHALAGVGVDPQTLIEFQMRGVSLESALGHLLKPLELTFIVRDEAILITTLEVADNHQELRLYPIGDLIDARRRIDADSLIDLILTTMRPATWADSGGAGNIDSLGHCLAFSQSRECHDEVERLLADLRRVRDSANAWDSPSPRSPAQQRLETALAAKVTFKFEQIPLADVARRLSKEHGIAVQLDKKALDGLGISPSLPVTYEADDLSLESAVRWMLQPMQLEHMVRGEALVITTPEVADNGLETRCYRIHRALPRPVPLVSQRETVPTLPTGVSMSFGWSCGIESDYHPVVDAITTIVAPATWQEAGGAGVIETFGNVLVVSQTRDVHETIHDLLSKIPKLLRTASPAPPVWVGQHDAPWCTRLEEALEKIASLNLDEISLTRTVSQLSADCGISLLLDEPNLETWLGWNGVFRPRRHLSEVVVSCSLPEMKLCHGLDLMLGQLGLAYVLRPGVVLVTTPKVAGDDLRVRIYDVRDVVDRHVPILGEPDPFEEAGSLSRYTAPGSLNYSITNLIAPATWEDAGGAGAIVELNGLYIITQTAEVHRQVESFLALLRRLPMNPTEFTTVEFDVLEGARTAEVEALLAQRDDKHQYNRVSLYPVPDLLHSDAKPAPRAAGSKLPYYLQQLQERAPPRPVPVERALDRPATHPTHSPEFAEAIAAFLPSLDVGYGAFGNYIALSSRRREPLNDMESLLTQVRKLRSGPIVEPPVPVSAAVGEQGFGLTVFDLRYLLARYPKLDQQLLKDWVQDQLPMDRWAGPLPHVGSRWPFRYGPLGLWGELLLVAAETERQREIHVALRFLARLPDDLPRPGDVARGGEGAVAKFAALIEKETDPRRLEYVLWLLGRVEKPVPALVAALEKRLERIDFEQESRLGARIYVVLAGYGPAAASAVPLVSAQIEGDESTPYQTLRIEVLAALGPRGVVELCRLAPTQLGLAATVDRALRGSPWQGEALATLLPMLVDSTQNQLEVIRIIGVLDPRAIASRELLDQWRDKDSNPERRRIAVEAEQVLERHFGERVTK